MKREEFVAAVGARLGDQDAADVAVAVFCDTIIVTVAAGGHLTVDGFGTFRRVQRPRRGRVPPTYVPRFDAHQAFKDAVAARFQA